MIDILVPTFNRANELEKNLLHLDEIINQNNLNKYYQILISNNASTDNTLEILEKIKKVLSVRFVVYNQISNIGLEKNSIFLLKKAESDYIMYIGDDDYVEANYLVEILKIIGSDSNCGAVIPNIDGLHSNGKIYKSRDFKDKGRKFPPSFEAVKKLSRFGHQLSGILLYKKNLYKLYTKNINYRNIYPFIFFLSYNILHRNTYLSKGKIFVSVDNKKDWKYDNSGLITEMIKNYNILYPSSLKKRIILSFHLIKRVSWRIGVNNKNISSLKAIAHILKTKNIDICIKILIPFWIMLIYFRRVKNES